MVNKLTIPSAASPLLRIPAAGSRSATTAAATAPMWLPAFGVLVATTAAAPPGGLPGVLPEGLVGLWRSWSRPRRPIGDLEQAGHASLHAREGRRIDEQPEVLPRVRLDGDLVARRV